MLGGTPKKGRLIPRGGAAALVAAAALLATVVSATAALAAQGDLTYRGCLSGRFSVGPAPFGSGACEWIPTAQQPFGANSGLDGVKALTSDPGGTSVYSAAEFDDAVARFARDPATGALGFAGCVTGRTQAGPGGSGACEAIPSASLSGEDSGLDTTTSLAASADGTSVYLGSELDDSVAHLGRDPSTGELSYVGCITGEIESGPTGSDACEEIAGASAAGEDSGLDRVRSVVVSGDGTSVYVSTQLDDSVAHLDRNPATGELSYVGCITGEVESGPGGSDACAAIGSETSGGDNSGLGRPVDLAVSPDDAFVYAVAEGDVAVARFARDPATGELDYLGCITGSDQAGPAPGSGACEAIPSATEFGGSSGLASPQSLAISPDGASLYVAAESGDAVAHLSRNAVTGALSWVGCVTGSTNAGPAGSGACDAIPSASEFGGLSGLNGAARVAVSSDGASVYAATNADSSVAHLRRNPATGALSWAGCLTGDSGVGPEGSGACGAIPSAAAGATDSGLNSARSLALSPDGASVYAGSFDSDAAVARFDRELAPPAPPVQVVSNRFGFGKVRRNRRRGTARLVVRVPGPGVVVLRRNRRVRRAVRRPRRAGRVALPVRARGKARRRLNRTGRVIVALRVTYRPTGGEPRTRTRKLRLLKRR